MTSSCNLFLRKVCVIAYDFADLTECTCRYRLYSVSWTGCSCLVVSKNLPEKKSIICCPQEKTVATLNRVKGPQVTLTD